MEWRAGPHEPVHRRTAQTRPPTLREQLMPTGAEQHTAEPWGQRNLWLSWVAS